MMRVILQISDGPDIGRKILLRSRHELKVGRTSWAEFVCDNDTKMSRVHFKVVTDSVGCYVEDLDSSNGTFLNGEKVVSERLKHGDRIKAGRTTFLVQIEGDNPDLTGSYVGVMPAAGAAAATKRAGPVQYARKKCQSEIFQYSLAVEDVPPATLAEQLTKAWPLFLMVDFNRTGGVPPEDLQRSDLLFDWLPDEVAKEYPVLISQHDTAETLKLIEEFIAKDALVLLFSKANRGQLLEHLKVSCRTRVDDNDDSGGLFGICWPSVMGQLLPNGDYAFIDRIMTGINAVMVVMPDAPDKSLLFGDDTVEKALVANGYQLDPESVEPAHEDDDDKEAGKTEPD